MTNLEYSESASLDAVLDDIVTERQAQDAKFGAQNHDDGTQHVGDYSNSGLYRELCQHAFNNGRGTWRHILLEEVYEALAESDPNALRTELIQVAAVAVAWVQALDRRAIETPAAE